MQNRSMGSLVFMVLAAAGLAAGQSDSAQSSSPGKGQTEIRVFVFTRNWIPLDLNTTSATLDIWPKSGSKRTYKLECTPCGSSAASTDPQKGESSDKDKSRNKGHTMVCGQIRDLDPMHIELVVCNGNAVKRMESAAKSDPEARGSEEHKHAWHGGLHDHGVNYLKVILPDADLQDSATKVTNFEAYVNITLAGDTKTVKGFQYPEGYVQDRLERFIDYDLKDLVDEAKVDPNQAREASYRIQWALVTLPTLSFKKDEDRKEYEKAVGECRDSCIRLENTHGKEFSAAVETCRAKCKEVLSQAKDAQGALSAE